MALKQATLNQPDRIHETTAVAEYNLNSTTDRSSFATNVVRSQRVGREPWKWYERLGEVHKAISRSARIAGYARLRCVEINDDGTDGATVTDGLPADIVRNIYSRFGGVRGLIDRFYALMKVPGDSYLIQVRDPGEPTHDGYHFLSSDEIERASVEESLAARATGGIRWITLPHTARGSGEALAREVEASDVLGRVWLPGRRWIDDPDSPLGALTTECEVLHGLTESMKANIFSRFALAGILFIPSEIQDVKVVGKGSAPTEDILSWLMEALSRNVANVSDAKARLPILLRGKGESGEQIRHITIDREVFQTDIELRNDLIERILFGLDIQKQATKGTEQSSHWSSWMASDEEVRIAVQPDLDTMCWALTRLVLHRQLEEAEYPPDQTMRLRVAWDMSEAAARTNKQEDTRQARDMGLAKGDSVLRVSGLSVTDDKMDDQERIRWIGEKQSNVYLACFTGDSYADIDWEMAARFAKLPPGPPDQSETQDSTVGPGVGDPGSPGQGPSDRTKEAE
jgi:hypothetical protein